MTGRPGGAPRERIAAACAERGVSVVVADCLTLMADGEADPALLLALGGPDAPRYLDGPPDQRYWLRVWGTRGLLWALDIAGAPPPDDPLVTAAVSLALGDERWRVREMAAKVAARHRIDGAQPAIVPLLTDEIPRVRHAASRALRLLTTA
jgi:HEAT repeat protein